MLSISIVFNDTQLTEYLTQTSFSAHLAYVSLATTALLGLQLNRFSVGLKSLGRLPLSPASAESLSPEDPLPHSELSLAAFARFGLHLVAL